MVNARLLVTALAATAATLVDALPASSSRASTASASASASASTSTVPIVDTSLGKVQGMVSPFRNGSVNVYKGIPYAAPPVGDLRWAAPQNATAWSGVRNTTEFGLQCAQDLQGTTAGIFSSGKTTSSEDCLTLNIWTPANATSSSKLGVYFWIFGGRFEGGAGDVPTYDGSGLASKDVLVVTLNYRLGAFGFLAHPSLSAESGHNSSGNFGILDQQKALAWVHANIAAFGGDPEQIVVGGQSAGSSSALDVMYSNLTRGLGVAGIIAESGARAPHDPMTAGLATSHRWKDEAEAAGEAWLSSTLNVSSIAEARQVNVSVIAALGNAGDSTIDATIFGLSNLTDAFTDPPLWRPVVDGYVFPYGYGETLAKNAHLDVPILTGNNKDESGAADGTTLDPATYTAGWEEILASNATLAKRFFELYPAGADANSTGDIFNGFFRDLSRVGSWEWAKEWHAGGANSSVFTYYWTTTPAINPTSGAYHGSELWYTFNNIPYSDYENVTWREMDYEIADTMSDYWVNFISTGDPNEGPRGVNATFVPTTVDKYETMWLGDAFEPVAIANSTAKVEFILEWISTLTEW